jgi:hypothetical protein
MQDQIKSNCFGDDFLNYLKIQVQQSNASTEYHYIILKFKGTQQRAKNLKKHKI